MSTDISTDLDAVLNNIDTVLEGIGRDQLAHQVEQVAAVQPRSEPAPAPVPVPVRDEALERALEEVAQRAPDAVPTGPVHELVSTAGAVATVQAVQAPAGPRQGGQEKGKKRGAKDPLPDGVLGKAGAPMATAIGVIAVAAMGEAGYNLAHFVHDILGLPPILAGVFPVIAETTALSFAVQDLKDRRQGVKSLAMRVATYVTLAISAVVNGVVGVAMYGLGGLLEVLAPLALGVVIHLHGERATRAHHSRARLSEPWRAEQLRAAQIKSVVEILPLLAGDDEDGKETVALLRWRLDSATLEPDEALIAAGWHERGRRQMSESRLRRLETVAATVWTDGNRPTAPTLSATPAPAPAPTPSATPAPTPAPTPSATPAPTRARSTPSTPARPGADAGEGGSKADDATLAALVAQARRARPNAGEGSVRLLLQARGLTASSRRIRAAVAAVSNGTTTSSGSNANSTANTAGQGLDSDSRLGDAVSGGGDRG